MADREKRRAAVSVPAETPPDKSLSSNSDLEFLTQAGVGELLREAILKLVEARSEDPIGFLADHFCNLAAVADSGACREEEQEDSGARSSRAREQQHLNRALWHLRLAHHSQRSAFSNNVRVAYDLLNFPISTTPAAEASDSPTGCSSNGDSEDGAAGGGVRGDLFMQTLRCMCSEGGVPASTYSPLLRRLYCQDHEAVPYDVFRHGVLTCAVFSDFIRQSQKLYAEVCSPKEGPASRKLCQAVLRTLKDALETSKGCDPACCANANTKDLPCAEGNVKAVRYLEASAKISPSKLAQAMAGVQSRAPGGNMDAKEFENAAAELFITRVKVLS